MAQAKRKPVADTETLLSEAHANLAAVDAEIAELHRVRLEIEPGEAIKKDIDLAAARKDAERRVALLEERAAQELRARQVKAQEALRGRVENKFAERDRHIEAMCKHMADMVSEMKLAVAANGEAAAAWAWDSVRDNEACMFGLFLRAAIRHELYRLSGDPYESATNRGSFSFPGAEAPTPFGDLNPKSGRPLVEKAREASAYASRIMQEAPIRTLPPVVPPPPKPIEIKPTAAIDPAVVTIPEPTPQPRPEPEYVWRAKFVNMQTGEEKVEEITFGPSEIAEASLDGLGGTGPLARSIALRLATERTPENFMFVPDSLRFDLQRLMDTMNRD
jgi:hypothetical protein